MHAWGPGRSTAARFSMQGGDLGPSTSGLSLVKGNKESCILHLPCGKFFPKGSSQDFTRDSRRRQGAETSVAKAHFGTFHIQAKGYLWAKGGTQGVKGT
jgi:hypothetical protein